MRIAAPTALVLSACLAGCGPGGGQVAPPAPTPSTGPHGGPAVPLPGDSGFGEVVVEPMPSRSAPLNARVAVYFLERDLKSPLSPPPTDVRLDLDLPGGESAALPLSPEPKADDAAGRGRFVSRPGPYLMDQVMGKLTATVSGQGFTRPFATPH
jgi:hypothetical protein